MRYIIIVNNDGIIQSYNSGSIDVLPDGGIEVSEEVWQEAIDNKYNSYTKGLFGTVDIAPTEREIRSEFKREREYKVKNMVVEFEGNTYDADEESQNRMLRPIAALPDDTALCTWVTHTNTTVSLTRVQLRSILYLAGEAQTAIWVQPK